MEILRITDGTTTIDLLDPDSGFILNSWRPQIPGFKGGGVFRDSPLSHGRTLIDYRYQNVVDVFNLKLRAEDPDKAIWHTQELRRLLVKAVDYWATNWQNEIVWIEAKASCETNTRYAWIISWRTPEDENPFGQPFLQYGNAAVMDNFQLAIEHGPWLANKPGLTTLAMSQAAMGVGIAGYGKMCFPSAIIFSAVASNNVNCGSDASIDDLPLSDMTVEAWIYPQNWGGGGDGRIIEKTRWAFLMETATSSLFAFASFDVQDANSKVAFSPDNQWHHVAAVWDAATAKYRIWIDGVEPAYIVQQAGNNNYDTDAAFDLIIGNVAALNRNFGGYMGWVRLSSGKRYTADFTPPPRCVLPDIDANTIGQWIYEGTGTAIDNMEGTAALDGTGTNIWWLACDCYRYYGSVDEDDDIDPSVATRNVYISNKSNRMGLTHIFIDDGGTFGGNLVNASLPYDLLPAVPAVNDAVYFGIDSRYVNGGPFSSLVFYLQAAQSDLTNVQWQYWNGAAWTALTVQDNTANGGGSGGVAFSYIGIYSVHWVPPSDWETTTVNAVTGWWVRAIVLGVGANPSPPTQRDRDVYTITWPFADIDDGEVKGDIPALCGIDLLNWSHITGGSVAHTNKIIVGLRSRSRDYVYPVAGIYDDDHFAFDAYLNISDRQLANGQTVTLGANTAFADDVEAPTGRIAVYNPAGAEAMADRVTINLGGSLVRSYKGRFRAILRGAQVGGAAGDIEVRLIVSLGDLNIDIFTSDSIATQNTLDWQAFDFGAVTIPGASLLVSDENIWDIDLKIQASNSNAGAPPDFNFYDLILIPIDEWAGEFTDFDSQGRGYIGYQSGVGFREYLRIDSIKLPKKRLRAPLESSGQSSTQIPSWKISSPGELILQANADQRFWFLVARKDTSGNIYYEPWISHSVAMYANDRYLSMRGDR